MGAITITIKPTSQLNAGLELLKKNITNAMVENLGQARSVALDLAKNLTREFEEANYAPHMPKDQKKETHDGPKLQSLVSAPPVSVNSAGQVIAAVGNINKLLSLKVGKWPLFALQEFGTGKFVGSYMRSDVEEPAPHYGAKVWFHTGRDNPNIPPTRAFRTAALFMKDTLKGFGKKDLDEAVLTTNRRLG